eukprot:1334014-Amorphochlora_amoeboformis.AAC.1
MIPEVMRATASRVPSVIEWGTKVGIQRLPRVPGIPDIPPLTFELRLTNIYRKDKGGTSEGIPDRTKDERGFQGEPEGTRWRLGPLRACIMTHSNESLRFDQLYLDMPNVVHNLKYRYNEKKIYTGPSTSFF